MRTFSAGRRALIALTTATLALGLAACGGSDDQKMNDQGTMSPSASASESAMMKDETMSPSAMTSESAMASESAMSDSH